MGCRTCTVVGDDCGGQVDIHSYTANGQKEAAPTACQNKDGREDNLERHMGASAMCGSAIVDAPDAELLPATNPDRATEPLAPPRST